MHQASGRPCWLLSRQVTVDLLVEGRKARSMTPQQVAAVCHPAKLHGHFGSYLTGPEDDLVGDACSEPLEIDPAQLTGALAGQLLCFPGYGPPECLTVIVQLSSVQHSFVEISAIAPFAAARYDERIGDEPRQRPFLEERVGGVRVGDEHCFHGFRRAYEQSPSYRKPQPEMIAAVLVP